MEIAITIALIVILIFALWLENGVQSDIVEKLRNIQKDVMLIRMAANTKPTSNKPEQPEYAKESVKPVEQVKPNDSRKEKMNDARLRTDAEWSKIIDDVLDYKEKNKIADKKLFAMFGTTRDGLVKHANDDQFERWERLRQTCQQQAREEQKKTMLKQGNKKSSQNK